MKSFLSLVVPAFLSASLFAAAPQAPRPPQAPVLAKSSKASDTPEEKKSPLSILVLSKTGCEPCRRLAEELKTHGGDLAWDIWKDSRHMEAKYGGVSLYPTILLLKDGKEVGRRIGYTSVGELSRWLEETAAVE
jgi:thiol-disulfide isomerase/thioredoxin